MKELAGADAACAVQAGLEIVKVVLGHFAVQQETGYRVHLTEWMGTEIFSHPFEGGDYIEFVHIVGSRDG
ncbi:hypothetical protein D3C81_1882570 [compost metagenome]